MLFHFCNGYQTIFKDEVTSIIYFIVFAFIHTEFAFILSRNCPHLNLPSFFGDNCSERNNRNHSKVWGSLEHTGRLTNDRERYLFVFSYWSRSRVAFLNENLTKTSALRRKLNEKASKNFQSIFCDLFVPFKVVKEVNSKYSAYCPWPCARAPIESWTQAADTEKIFFHTKSYDTEKKCLGVNKSRV